MTWLVLESTKYRHATEEIVKQRDRGAGIIAVSILEEHLVAAIQTRFNRNKNIEKKLLSGFGPLSTLGAKIDLGFLLGLYPSRVHTMLHEIRELRNDFAHNPLPVSFRSQKDRCARLAFRRGIRRAWQKSAGGQVFAEKAIKTTLFRSSQNPRTQFLGAVKAITAILALQTMAANEERWTKQRDLAPQPADLATLSTSAARTAD